MRYNDSVNEKNFHRRELMYYEERDFLETADQETLDQIARARELTREYYHSDYHDTEKRKAILKELLGEIGENVEIDTPLHCDHGKNIFIGDDVIIGINCTFVDNAPIRIGDRVMIASNVQFYTASHPVLPQERLISNWRECSETFYRTYARPIEIKDNVWIGGGCILLPGVTIGENSVIGAGSVVTRSIPANCVAVGNPCRVIRQLEEVEG
jgi:maltose O-acetyltransferase